MSLIFFLVRRALTRAFGNTRHTNTSEKPYPANHDIIETIWIGMSSRQLISTFGTPEKKEIRPTDEIWTYKNLNGQGILTNITLENGIIKNWKDITSSLPTH